MTAYGALLPQAALDIPAHGWVNLHFSVLPAWRGAAPVQHAVLRGDDITGATTFRIVKELDAGPVFGTLTEPVRPTDTSGDLLARLAVVRRGAPGRDPGRDRGRHRRAPSRSRPTASASPPSSPRPTPGSTGSSPAHLIDRQIRACTPDPGAWTEFDARRQALAGHAGSSCSAAPSAAAPAWRPAGRAGARRAPRRPNAVYVGHRHRAGPRSATSSRRASAACPPPTGPAACSPTGAMTSLGSPDMSDYRTRRARARRRPGTAGQARQADAASEAGGGRARRPRPADPRRTAYDVLAAVRDREAYANLLLPRLLAERGLTGRDAALATELAYGTLRGQGSYDAVLAACSDRPLGPARPAGARGPAAGRAPAPRTRIGAHAAVATSVDLARSVVGPRVAGYVNAVLRRVATRDLRRLAGHRRARAGRPTTTATSPSATAIPGGSSPPTVTPSAPRPPSRPGPLRPARRRRGNRGRGNQGRNEASPSRSRATRTGDEPAREEADTAGGEAVTELEAALAAGNARPRVTLATFPPGPPRAEVMPAAAAPGRWSPYAFTLRSGDPAALVESGAAAVQDEGSQLAALALSRVPVTPVIPQAGPPAGAPERWLDLCAGPGGKSRLLYGLAAGSGATLVAAELHPHRAALVRGALASAGPARAAPATRWSSPTAPARRGRTARLTGSSSMPRAPVSARCAAARRPAGASRKPTSRSSPRSSATCSARPWPRSAPAAWSPT